MDGTWQIKIVITDVEMEQNESFVTVNGSVHIGGVMLKLVDSVGKLFRNYL